MVFRQRRKALVFLVASLAHAFGHAALALAAGRCAVLLATSMAGGVAHPPDPLRTAIVMGSIGLCAALAKTVGGVVAAHGQAAIGAKAAGMLRLEVLDGWFASYTLRRPRHDDHGPSMPPQPMAGSAHGVSALTSRVRDVEVGLSSGVLGAGRAVAQLLPLAAALAWLSPKLAVVAVAVFAPLALLLGTTRQRWKRAHREAAVENEQLLEAADEAIRHADLWVAYSAEAKARASLRKLGEGLAARSARLDAGAAAMSGGNEVLGALALVLALVAARAGWLGDVGGSGQLLGFTVCFFLAYRPVRDLAEARLAWTRAVGAFEDLGVADAGDVSGDSVTRRPRSGWTLQDLHVDNLMLRHGVRAPWSFTVEAGSVVVVVGATGEGKTSLLRALLGIEPAERGRVRYGGVSLDGAPPGLAGRPFAWVPQDSPLLLDTLEANVTLGGPADVHGGLEALGAAHLEEATRGARLGPGGAVLSGGEKQWVGLARAMATRQPVLLLDEPTSGLDAASQEKVLEAISRLRGRRSVILVTHRPEPLALADVIVRVEGGRVSVEAPPRSRERAPA
jgi:ATP-binding cassette subfamily B protein